MPQRSKLTSNRLKKPQSAPLVLRQTQKRGMHPGSLCAPDPLRPGDRNTTALPIVQQRGGRPSGTLQPPQLQRGERRLGATVDRWNCGAVLLLLLLWHTCGAWLRGAIAVSLGSFDCLVKSTAKAHLDELACGAVTAWRRSRHVDFVCCCPSRFRRSTRRSHRLHDWDTMNEAYMDNAEPPEPLEFCGVGQEDELLLRAPDGLTVLCMSF